MSEKLREAAQQALDALEDSHQNINPERSYADELTRQIADAITALRAALSEDFCRPAQPVQEPLTIERLRDALVASRIIPPAAVEDPDEYDDWVTLSRIESLHRRLT